MQNMTNVCRLCLKLQKKSSLNVNIFEGPDYIANFVNEIFQLSLEEVVGWPSEACKRCEKLVNDIRNFREDVLLAQSTLLSESMVVEEEEETQCEVTQSELKAPEQKLADQEEEDIEITELPETYFEDSGGEEQPTTTECRSPITDPQEGIADDMAEKADYKESADNDTSTDTPRKRRRMTRAVPERQQPRRENKKVYREKRTTSSYYTLSEEAEMEVQMKAMGWFKCHICSKELDNSQELSKHFLDTHNAYGYIMCCDGKRRCGLQAYEHFAYHKDANAFACPICQKALLSRVQLKLHMKDMHEPKPLQCEHCHKQYSSRGKLTQHINHHFKPIKCKYCDKGFQNTSHLKRHVERMHEIANRVVCDICGKWFSCESTLNIHLARHKSQLNKKTCPHCGKLVADLKQHVDVVHLGTRRGGIIRIPGLDSQGRPLTDQQEECAS